ncbi:hypothetical protein FQZ97_1114270 [compost metagenome]
MTCGFGRRRASWPRSPVPSGAPVSLSTTTSLPGMARPIDPGFTGAEEWLLATIKVSVRPYASINGTSVAPTQRLTTSGFTASPADTASRSRSIPAWDKSSLTRWRNSVAAAQNTVTPCRAISASRRAGSNLPL